MRSQFKRCTAIGAAVVVATLWSAPSSVLGQSATPYKAPRAADGHPNLNGIWQALNTANWDLENHGAQLAPHHNLVGAYLAQPPGLSVVEGGAIPYKPEALAKRRQNFETRLKPDPIDPAAADPEAKCFQGGVPRGAYLPYPFQIFQTADHLLIAYEYAASPRIIHLDKKDVNPLLFEGVDTWIGQSAGRWEGETLVVDVKGFSGTVWLDRAGNFMSQTAEVVERYTPMSPNHLRYEATITDPTVFTRPWKISMPLYRRMEPNVQLLEFQCVPLAEEFIYGKLKKPGK